MEAEGGKKSMNRSIILLAVTAACHLVTTVALPDDLQLR